MSRKKWPSRRREILEEHKGKTYSARYYVGNDSVTVEALSKDLAIVERTAHPGTSAEMTARLLLRELIERE